MGGDICCVKGCKKTTTVSYFRIPKVNARCTPSNKEKQQRRRVAWLKVLRLNLDLPPNNEDETHPYWLPSVTTNPFGSSLYVKYITN